MKRYSFIYLFRYKILHAGEFFFFFKEILKCQCVIVTVLVCTVSSVTRRFASFEGFFLFFLFSQTMVTTVSKCCAHTRAAQQYRREERKTRKESTKETENRERLFAYSAPTEKVLDQFISQFRRRAPPKKIHTQNMVILQETKSNKATNAQCVYEFSSCRWSFASIFNP
jgi:hypothetical protein